MAEKQLDPAKEIAKQTKAYGDRIVLQLADPSQPSPKSIRRAEGFARALIPVAFVLAFLGYWGMLWHDMQDNGVYFAELVAAKERYQADLARADADRIKAQAAPAADSEKKKSTPPPGYELADLRATILAAAAHKAEVQIKGAALSKAAKHTTFGDFRARAVNLLAPAMLVLVPLLLCAGLTVLLCFWVKMQAAQLLETVLKGAAAGVAPRTGDRRSSGAVLGSPASAGSSLGGFALRAGAATAAVGVTAGVFLIAIPDHSIPVRLRGPEAAEARVKVGDFDVSVPGGAIPLKLKLPDSGSVDATLQGDLSFDLPKDLIPLTLSGPDPEALKAEVQLGEFKVNIPGKVFDVPPDRVRLASGGGSATVYEPMVTVRVPDVYLQLDAGDLGSTLTDKLTVLGDRMEQAQKASTAALVRAIDGAADTQHKGTLLDAIDQARRIDVANSRFRNRHFRRTLIQENCQAYHAIKQAFPDLTSDYCKVKPPPTDPQDQVRTASSLPKPPSLWPHLCEETSPAFEMEGGSDACTDPAQGLALAGLNAQRGGNGFQPDGLRP